VELKLKKTWKELKKTQSLQIKSSGIPRVKAKKLQFEKEKTKQNLEELCL
jgi:hypothetical protein